MQTYQLITEFISKIGYEPKSFREVAIDILPFLEEKNECNILFYDFGIQEGEFLGENLETLIRQSNC